MAFETKASHIMFLRFIMREAKTAKTEETLASLQSLYEDVQAIACADGANIPSFAEALKSSKKQG
jgi:hypothetical protein